MNVGIFIYSNAEVLDFAGPFEVFATAARLGGDSYPFCPMILAETVAPVLARGGFQVAPHCAIDSHPPLDILVVVGGVHSAELAKAHVVSWLASTADRTPIVASVCTGAFLLAEAGLLNGRRITTHWEDIPALRRDYPDVEVLEAQRWVEDGKFITSAGISAGIDMSLHLVGKWATVALAEATARQMEYAWRPLTSVAQIRQRGDLRQFPQ